MTTDALLALLLNIIIPSLLAVAGGVLAIRTFRDAKSAERWAWIGVFLFLFVIAVVLGFIQQIRQTSQQEEVDEKTAAAELRNEGNVKYMQGQLDSINKVLTTVVSQGGDSGLAKTLLKALAAQASAASSHKSISISLEPPSEGRRDTGWLYTWKHGLDTFTPLVSCVDSSGHEIITGAKVVDQNTVILNLPKIKVNCKVQK